LQVETKIVAGPREDLNGYLLAVDDLRNNIEFFTFNNSFKNNDSALSHAHGLLSKAMSRLEEEFKVLLTTHR
jgi:exocyst complex protein 7